jgi:hypothetical protein
MSAFQIREYLSEVIARTLARPEVSIKSRAVPSSADRRRPSFRQSAAMLAGKVLR